MTEREDSPIVRIEIQEVSDIDEFVLAFRQEGELTELASTTPPVVAELKALNADERA